MSKSSLFLFILCVISNILSAQKVVFLHHSTGGGVYFEGNVQEWISNYNTTHGTVYQVTERAYPDSPYPWENYPYDYWNLWVNSASTCNNNQQGIECIGSLTSKYNVIIFKHCFPGAGIEADEATSSVSSSNKTLGNYKLQYRALRNMMDKYPGNKFIVWTLAPLHRNATTPAQAARAKQFVDWVKTTWLTEDGKNHPNIFVFDFWGIVAETNPSPSNGMVNCLKYDYEGSHSESDSHPNTVANQLAGPLFADFIVKTLESVTAIKDNSAGEDFCSVTTQSGKSVTVKIKNGNPVQGVFTLYDVSGREVFNKMLNDAAQTFSLHTFTQGVYCYKITGSGKASFGKLILKD